MQWFGYCRILLVRGAPDDWISEVRSIVAEKKVKDPSRTILIVSGILLFLIGAGVLIITSVQSRRKLIDEIDRSFANRADKIMSMHDLDGLTLVSRTESLDDDTSDGDGEGPSDTEGEGSDEGTDGEGSDAITQQIISGTGDIYSSYLPEFDIMTARADSVPGYSATWYVPEDIDRHSFFTDSYYSRMYLYTSSEVIITSGYLVQDFDGDVSSTDVNGVIFQPGGLMFAETLQFDDVYNIKTMLKMVNVESQRLTELYTAAETCLKGEDLSGWENNYRYYIFSEEVFAKRAEKPEDADAFYQPEIEYMYKGKKADAAWDSIKSLMKENGFTEYTLRNILFYDASSDLETWQDHVLWNIGVVLGCYILFMLVLTALLYVSPKMGLAGTAGSKVSEDPSAEAGDGQAISGPERCLTKEAAEALLSKIDAAESFSGPNGYLEDLRETVNRIAREDDLK